MQAERQGQRDARRHHDRLALDRDLVRRALRAGKMRRGGALDDVAEVGALPMAAGELVVRLAERDKAALEGLAERLGRIGAARRLRRQRLHRRQRVLDAVIELVDQELLAIFGFLALGDVLHDAHAVEEMPGVVAHGG